MKFFQLLLLSTREVKKEILSSSNLFPYDDIITKEIESWKSYADCLRKHERELFYDMLKSCYKYSSAINAKVNQDSFSTTTSVIMSILIEHHKNLLYKVKQNKQ